MEKREIKFRGMYKGSMVCGNLIIGSYGETGFTHIERSDANDFAQYDVDPQTIGQYTGRKDKNGDEIYEGDIFRVEEDQENLIYYLIVVWVNEWSMFCVLRCDDEYQEYLRNGIESLDEPMFWTYTLEDTSDRKFFLCGNIHQNPDLVNYAGGAV